MMLLVKFTTLLPGEHHIENYYIELPCDLIGVTTASSWIRNILDAKTSFYFIKWFVVS